MAGTGTTTHIYLNPVKADRADEWEAFTRTVIMAAVQNQQPELVDRVRVLRADDQQDGAALFVFIFEGGDIEDFDLGPLLTAEYGEQEAGRRLEEWSGMFARDQHGWTCHEVPQDR